MGNRIDEAKGTVKEHVGDAIDDEEMEREGKLEKDAAKARREIEGATDEVRGKVEEEWGDLTDDPEAEARGKARQAEGKAKREG